jgi:uncharacterized OB-fold protein
VTDDVLTLKAFFESARAGTLTAIRCDACGELAVPPKEHCPACQRREWQSVPLHGTGTVTSFTVIRIPPRSTTQEATTQARTR